MVKIFFYQIYIFIIIFNFPTQIFGQINSRSNYNTGANVSTNDEYDVIICPKIFDIDYHSKRQKIKRIGIFWIDMHARLFELCEAVRFLKGESLALELDIPLMEFELDGVRKLFYKGYLEKNSVRAIEYSLEVARLELRQITIKIKSSRSLIKQQYTSLNAFAEETNTNEEMKEYIDTIIENYGLQADMAISMLQQRELERDNLNDILEFNKRLFHKNFITELELKRSKNALEIFENLTEVRKTNLEMIQKYIAVLESIKSIF